MTGASSHGGMRSDWKPAPIWLRLRTPEGEPASEIARVYVVASLSLFFFWAGGGWGGGLLCKETKCQLQFHMAGMSWTSLKFRKEGLFFMQAPRCLQGVSRAIRQHVFVSADLAYD